MISHITPLKLVDELGWTIHSMPIGFELDVLTLGLQPNVPFKNQGEQKQKVQVGHLSGLNAARTLKAREQLLKWVDCLLRDRLLWSSKGAYISR